MTIVFSAHSFLLQFFSITVFPKQYCSTVLVNFAVFHFMEKSQLGNINQTVVAHVCLLFLANKSDQTIAEFCRVWDIYYTKQHIKN